MLEVIINFVPIFLGFAVIILFIYIIFVKKRKNNGRSNEISVSKLPLYEHDCNDCVFLGNYIEDNSDYDLYFCDKEPTVIARYSSIGQDYTSGLMFARPNVNTVLYEAKKRAIERGMYEED